MASNLPAAKTAAEPALPEAEYQMIEQAVMETARGRWFLAEYARRNRHADTTEILGALEQLQGTLAATRQEQEASSLRLGLNDMAAAIARTKLEIAALRPQGDESGPIDNASLELDAIVHTTEKATGDILGAAEALQEVGWTLRELGINAEVCDVIDARTTDIYTACSFQDLTGQRTQKVIQVLRYLEHRVSAMLTIWGGLDTGDAPAPMSEALREDAHLLNGPALPGQGLEQQGIDDVFALAPAAAQAAQIEQVEQATTIEPASPIDQVAPIEPINPADDVIFAPIPDKARATAAAALAMPEELILAAAAAAAERPPEPPAPKAGRKAAARKGGADKAAAEQPQSSTASDIEKLSFVEKTALFS